MRASLAGIVLSCACLAAGAMPGRAFAAADPGAPLLSHMFVDEAYSHSGDAALPAQLGARQAQLLLQMARDIDPSNAHTLKLLVEAAAANADTEVQREAIRGLIKADPGDLVAQVQYIDLLASTSQTIDARAKIYEGALGKTALDPQIRSEVAVRLARITRERGDVDGAKNLIKQALQLNDVNIGALREAVQLADQPDQRLQALVAQLTVCPLDPAAWGDAARVLEGVNLHTQAANFLITALEQTQLNGQQASGDVYLALGIDLCISSRFAEAYPILSPLAKLPDAPLQSLIAMRLLDAEYTAPSSMPGAASQPSADELAGTIHKMVAERVKADPKSEVALADALWTELSLFAQPSPEVESWMKSFQELVPADDPAVARFQGWQLLRAGKVEDARVALEKAGPGDAYAKLGIAHLLIQQKKLADAANVLQELWWNHPTGIFALQVAQTAYSAGGQGIRLEPAKNAGPLVEILKQLPSTAFTAHRQPRDYQLITTDMSKREYEYGEPIILNIRISNATSGPAAVGPDGMIKTTLGVLANLRGAERQNAGLVATEDLRRVFRLERRGSIETSIRLDQGKLDTLLQRRVLQTVLANIALVTAPVGTTANPAAGLGGQVLSGGDFQRNPFPMRLPDDADKLVQGTLAATGEQQMIRAQMLGVAGAVLAPKAPAPGELVTDQDPAGQAREKFDQTLISLLGSGSPTLRAFLAMTLPSKGVPDTLAKIQGFSADPDRIVRAAWATRMGALANEGGGAAPLDALEKQAGAEKDPVVRDWMNSLVEETRYRAAHPATQPATQKN